MVAGTSPFIFQFPAMNGRRGIDVGSNLACSKRMLFVIERGYSGESLPFEKLQRCPSAG